MQSIEHIFRYGMGPSSSHTIGPRNAAEQFAKRTPLAASYQVTLYGSLSLTGKGHLTDQSIIAGLSPKPVDIIWSKETLPFHPNGMLFEARDQARAVVEQWTVFSIGGGALAEEGASDEYPSIYPQKNMAEVLETIGDAPIWKLVEQQEQPDFIESYLGSLWGKMKESINDGLNTEGILHGPLHLARRARNFMSNARRLRDTEGRTGIISAYALAVAEQNADGGFVVTAPTCGSCGVLPAILYYLSYDQSHSEHSILRAMATAGVIGNIVKQNASIAGAEVGCQGEIGVACSMAAAAATQLLGGSSRQIEYAATMGLEHHLGLTCDPACGLVQVPCIERNAFAATRAMACAEYAMLSDGKHRVSYDEVIEVMKHTGHDMPSLYRETSLGGLAMTFKHLNE